MNCLTISTVGKHVGVVMAVQAYLLTVALNETLFTMYTISPFSCNHCAGHETYTCLGALPYVA